MIFSFLFASIVLLNDHDHGRFRIFEHNCSGSSQFSRRQWRCFEKKIPSKNIVVVDLREECHFLCNDDFAFKIDNFKAKDILRFEKDYAQKKHKHIDMVFFHKKARTKRTVRFIEPKISTEKDFIESCNINYKRFPVFEYHFPEDKVLSDFIKWVKVLDKDMWLHFHCRGGRGRTTLFMLIYDIIRTNAKFEFKQYLKRQISIQGTDLSRLEEDSGLRRANRVKRLKLLEKFYNDFKNGKY